MDYIGIDPAVGLECAECKQISRIAYSQLLANVSQADDVGCHHCQRSMKHDWTTVNVVQNIIRKRMEDANAAKARRFRAQVG